MANGATTYEGLYGPEIGDYLQQICEWHDFVANPQPGSNSLTPPQYFDYTDPVTLAQSMPTYRSSPSNLMSKIAYDPSWKKGIAFDFTGANISLTPNREEILFSPHFFQSSNSWLRPFQIVHNSPTRSGADTRDHRRFAKPHELEHTNINGPCSHCDHEKHTIHNSIRYCSQCGISLDSSDILYESNTGMNEHFHPPTPSEDTPSSVGWWVNYIQTGHDRRDGNPLTKFMMCDGLLNYQILVNLSFFNGIDLTTKDDELWKIFTKKYQVFWERYTQWIFERKTPPSRMEAWTFHWKQYSAIIAQRMNKNTDAKNTPSSLKKATRREAQRAKGYSSFAELPDLPAPEILPKYELSEFHYGEGIHHLGRAVLIGHFLIYENGENDEVRISNQKLYDFHYNALNSEYWEPQDIINTVNFIIRYCAINGKTLQFEDDHIL